MIKTKQMKLVLLYAIAELGGAGSKNEVLHAINSKGYWKKNDSNDVSQHGRKELKWRNEFAFERSHLAKAGYLSSAVRDEWKITPAGESFLGDLQQEFVTETDSNVLFCTESFRNKIRREALLAEAAEEQIFLETLNQSVFSEDTEVILKKEPMEQPKPTRHANGRKEYPRDAKVAENAFRRAEYRCENEETHGTFIRRSTQKPYLEPHHLVPLAYTKRLGVNLDREQNVVALCSHCHNQIHYGRYEDIKEILKKLYDKRWDELADILGRKIGLQELYSFYGIY